MTSPHLPAAYIAQDRRVALAAGVELPEWACGSVLCADISGFTPLSETLANDHGQRRGAEALTHLLNDLYARLIAEVERHAGSVVGFSGDAITCWFAAGPASTPDPDTASDADHLGDAPLRAADVACAMQQTLRDFATHPLVTVAPLAVKVAIASGRVRRAIVGDPTIQLHDVLAGSTLNRMALGEQLAHAGETLADERTLRALAQDTPPSAWRGPEGARFALLDRHGSPFAVAPKAAPLPDVDAAGWIHPAVAPLLRGGQAQFLAELRPATALFVRFGGIDFEGDDRAMESLDAYMRCVQRIIQRYEGLLVQLTTGDKGSYFYVAFGAPRAHGDDSARAAASALELRAPAPVRAQIGQVQVGISSGMMRIGAYGGPTRCTYGVLGDEANVAARLMSAAQAGQILVTGAVAEALGGAMILEPLGAQRIKGKTIPIALFAVHGRSEQPATQQLHLHDEPLLGRDAELAPLLAALAGVAAQRAGPGSSLLAIEGAAGIGKSHMAAALVKQAGTMGMRAVHAACQSTARGIPFFAVRQVVRSLLDLTADATAEDVHRAVAGLAADAEPRAPLLAEVLDIPMINTSLTSGLEARVRQSARTGLILELIEAVARHRPLLLVLEDAHWADEASRDIYALLTASLPPATALLIVQRPPEDGEQPLIGDDTSPGCVCVRLSELARDATAALIAQRLDGPIDALVADVIHAQSQGNPFFIEELVVALRDAGHIELGQDGWRLSHATVTRLRAAHCLSGDIDAPRLIANAPLAVVDLGVPTSVQGVVLARLDRLPETARLTLKVASVIGRSFALEVLRAVRPLQGRRAELQAALEQALARDFVRADAAGPSNESASNAAAPIYLFKHNIIRDVAYNTMLSEQKHELHRDVGEALEVLRPGDVEVLAHHFFSGDTAMPAVRRRAVEYLGRAAARAQKDYANDTALLYYGRAAGLDPRAAFLVGQVETLHILGRRAEQAALLARLDTAPDLDAATRARLWGDYYESIADYANAANVLEVGLAACATDLIAQAQCRNRLGMVAWRQADYAEAEAHFVAAHALCLEHRAQHGSTHAADSERASAHYGMGLVHRQLGRYDAARAAFGEDLAWQRTSGTRDHEARVRTALGHVESIAGRHLQALESYTGALAVHKEIGDRAGIGASLLAMAQALTSIGDYARALPHLEEALHVQQSIRNRFDEWLICNELGILHWLVGQYALATACLEAGLAVSRAIGSDFGVAYILCNLGQVQRDNARPQEGAATLRAALALALEQGDTALEATCRGDLALALLGLHEPDAAYVEATQAEALFTTLGQHDALTAVFAAQAHASLALGDAPAALDAARRGLANLAAHGGDFFPHRDGFWCAQVLDACGSADEANAAYAAAAQALHARAERISNTEMRSSYLNNIEVNRAIRRAAAAAPTQPLLLGHAQ